MSRTVATLVGIGTRCGNCGGGYCRKSGMVRAWPMVYPLSRESIEATVDHISGTILRSSRMRPPQTTKARTTVGRWAFARTSLPGVSTRTDPARGNRGLRVLLGLGDRGRFPSLGGLVLREPFVRPALLGSLRLRRSGRCTTELGSEELPWLWRQRSCRRWIRWSCNGRSGSWPSHNLKATLNVGPINDRAGSSGE